MATRVCIGCCFTIKHKVPSSCEIHPNATTVNEPGNVLLNVITTGNPPVYEYDWTHPDRRRLNGSNTLTFTASRRDAGTYKVSVYNSIGDRGYCESNVTVQFPPVAAARSPVIIKVHQNESIQCLAEGEPEPTFSWTSTTNKPLLTRDNGKTLVLNNATLEDSGNYTCTATNILGDSSSTSNVMVTFPPVAVTRSPVIIKVHQNESIQCLAEAEPEPALSWTSTTNKPLLTRDDGKTLVLINATLEDSGNYICTATNILGNSSSTSNVIVIYPVGCTIYPRVLPAITVNESDSVTLTCNTTGHPPVNQFSWTYPDGTRHAGSSILQYRASKMDITTYHCSVRNSIGGSANCTRNVIVQFIDLPEFPGFRSAVISKESPHFTLNISVNSHPAVNISRTRCQYSNSKHALVYKVLTNGTVSIFTVNITANDSQSCNCTFENEAGRVSAHIPIYKGDSWRWREGYFRILNQNLSSLHLQEIHKLNSTVKEMLENIYRFVSYVDMVTVDRFSKGSVIVDFKLHGISGLDVTDYLAPLKDAVAKSSVINGLRIGSIMPGGYVPPPTTSTTSTTATTVQTTTVEKPTTPSVPVDPIIIVVIVVVVVVVVLLIIFIVCYCKKKRSNKDDPDLVDQGGAVAIPMANEPGGRNNEGYTPSRYAERGPVEPTYDSVDRRPKDANDNPTQPKEGLEKPAYAAVDKTKKTKKKIPGEVYYADLEELKRNDDKAAGVRDPLPTGREGKIPENHQGTIYADYVGTKKPVGHNQNAGGNDKPPNGQHGQPPTKEDSADSLHKMNGRDDTNLTKVSL